MANLLAATSRAVALCALLLRASSALPGRGVPDPPPPAVSAVDDGELPDVPVTPAESALAPLGLYREFEGGDGDGDGVSSSSPCLPRHVHLSLGDERSAAAPGSGEESSEGDDDDDGAAAAAAVTVSFSVPSDAACRPDAVRVSVAYGVRETAERSGEGGAGGGGAAEPTEGDGGGGRRCARPEDVRWYNATSPRTGEYYESDWIYHVPLRRLRSGTEYWYRIEVEERKEEEEEEKSKAGGDRGPVENDLTLSIGEAAAALSLRRRTEMTIVRRGGREGLSVLLATSPSLSFRTAPLPGSSTPTKIALLGDLGQTYNSTRTMLNVLRETRIDLSSGRLPASLVVCAGDMSYADTDQPRWDNWFSLVEPLVSRTALQVAAGNHEIECDAVTRDVFVAYESRFRMPNPVGPAATEPVPEDEIDPERGCADPSVFRGSYDGGNAYYAFTHGMARIVALSPYSDASLGSRQRRWLERELRAVDRSVTPWVVAVMHTQFYTTFRGHNDEIQTTLMRQSVEPLFVRYGVNLVVSGHDHAYMRSRPMRYGASDPTGRSPVYVIVGEGGNREQHVKDYLRPEPEEWVERRDKTEYGFGTLEFVSATWARWRWLRDGSSDMLSASGEGGVTDSAWLQNQYFL